MTVNDKTPTFDHRASIVTYVTSQADKCALAGRGDEAAMLRALAGSIEAKLDAEPGRAQVSSPMDIIVVEVCRALPGALPQEVAGPMRGTEEVNHARRVAAWVGERRLGWSHGRLASFFERDTQTVSHWMGKVIDQRREDEAFTKLTDELLGSTLYCEHCLMPVGGIAKPPEK